MSFYKLETLNLPSESFDKSRYENASVNIRRYSIQTSASRWEKKFKSAYVGFSSEEVEAKESFSIVDGKLNITNGKFDYGGGTILRSTTPDDPIGDDAGLPEAGGSLDVELILA